MKIHIVTALMAAVLLQTMKMENAEIPVYSDMSAVEKPAANDTPAKFTCKIISTSTDEPSCSGTIISIHFVVSSCLRCLNNYGRSMPAEQIKIVTPEFSEIHSYGISLNIYGVRHVRLHPRCIFDGQYYIKYDIGLVQTVEEIEFEANVRPAIIPRSIDFLFNSNDDLMLSTFETTHNAATKLKDALWYTKVKTMPADMCSQVLNATYYDPDNTFCTPYHHMEPTDECKADYGASLSSGNVLVGILIHKFSCGLPGSAASFVNVTLNSNWIAKEVQKLSGGAESV